MKPLLGLVCAIAALCAAIPSSRAADAIEGTRAIKLLSIQEIQKLADGGDAKAEAELATRYGLGAGVPKDC